MFFDVADVVEGEVEAAVELDGYFLACKIAAYW